jgi:hypothetical protein
VGGVYLPALRETFNQGGHRGFFTDGTKLGGKFLTAEGAEVTELDGEEWLQHIFLCELCMKSLRVLSEPFNHGEHKGFFIEGAKRSGKFLTAEDAEVTELDGEE